MSVAIPDLEESIHSLEASISSTLPAAFAPVSRVVDFLETGYASDYLEIPENSSLTRNLKKDGQRLFFLYRSLLDFVEENPSCYEDVCQKIQELYDFSQEFSRNYREHLLSKDKKNITFLNELDESSELLYSDLFLKKGTIFLSKSLELRGIEKANNHSEAIKSLYQYTKREKNNILNLSKNSADLVSIFLTSIEIFGDKVVRLNHPSVNFFEIVSHSFAALDIFYELGLYTLIDEVNGKRVYLSPDSAEGKAIQRLEQIESGDDSDWITVVKEGQDVDVHSALERLKKRGYKINVSSSS